jgi:hypothetical protein
LGYILQALACTNMIVTEGSVRRVVLFCMVYRLGVPHDYPLPKKTLNPHTDGFQISHRTHWRELAMEYSVRSSG